MGRGRAVWRLARVAAHVACGLAMAAGVLPRLGPRARDVAIGRWARGVFRALGIGVVRHGCFAAPSASSQPGGAGAAQAPRGARMIVANHVSWLDIMAVHAIWPEARFVAMAEVQRWPLVPRLVRAAGTIYLERRRLRDLLRAVRDVSGALRAGDTVAVFPEGVVSDGRTLGRFHGNFLQAAIDAGTPVQAVALRYVDADAAVAGAVSAAPLFTGDITLAQSLWRLACARGLTLHVSVLPPRAAPHRLHRRALAAGLQADVARALAAMAARRTGQAASARSIALHA